MTTKTEIQDPVLKEVEIQYQQYAADIPVANQAMLEAVENGKQDRLQAKAKKVSRVRKAAAIGVAAVVTLPVLNTIGNSIDYEHEKRQPTPEQVDRMHQAGIGNE